MLFKQLIVLALFCSFFIRAQNNVVFPVINGITLEGKEVTLPLHNDKYSLIAIAFSRKAEDDLRRWLNPLYETFVHKEKNSNGFSPAEVNDVNFYFIPLISGFKKFADDFKKGTDKEFWQYIVDTEKTDIKEIHKKLALKDDNTPYFFILDKGGKVVEMQNGTYQSIKLDKLEDAVE